VHLILLCFAVGGACRARVIMKLSKLYSSPTDAERNLQVTAGKISKSLFPEAAPELAQFSPISIQTIINPGVNSSICSDISIECQDPLFEQILKLTLSEQFDLVGDVVHLIAEKVYGIDIPPDFVKLSLEAMKNLERAGKANVIYNLVVGFTKVRPDGTDYYFPIKRMPFGLLQYLSEFFVSVNGQRVSYL
jgi:hypothetical protein